MLQLVIEDLLEREDIEAIREVVQQEAISAKNKDGAVLRALSKQLDLAEVEAKKKSEAEAAEKSKAAKRKAVSREADDDIGEEQRDIEDMLDDSQDAENNDQEPFKDTFSSGRTFGKTFDFRPYLNSLTSGDNWEKVKQKSKCCSCDGRLYNGWMTSCGHLFCGSCYDRAVLEAAENNRANGSCKACGSLFTHANEMRSEDNDEIDGYMTRARKKQHSKNRQRIEQQVLSEDWLTFGNEGVLPSAKTIALKAQIVKWYVGNLFIGGFLLTPTPQEDGEPKRQDHHLHTVSGNVQYFLPLGRGGKLTEVG